MKMDPGQKPRPPIPTPAPRTSLRAGSWTLPAGPSSPQRMGRKGQKHSNVSQTSCLAQKQTDATLKVHPGSSLYGSKSSFGDPTTSVKKVLVNALYNPAPHSGTGGGTGNPVAFEDMLGDPRFEAIVTARCERENIPCDDPVVEAVRAILGHPPVRHESIQMIIGIQMHLPYFLAWRRECSGFRRAGR